MKDTLKLFSVFLDTSVLLSGLNSQLGASGIILSLFKLGRIRVCISPEVLAQQKIKTRVVTPGEFLKIYRG